MEQKSEVSFERDNGVTWNSVIVEGRKKRVVSRLRVRILFSNDLVFLC